MENKGTVVIKVTDKGGAKSPIKAARVTILTSKNALVTLTPGETDRKGEFRYDLQPGAYKAKAGAFGETSPEVPFTIKEDGDVLVEPLIDLNFGIQAWKKDNTHLTGNDFVTAGQPLRVKAEHNQLERPTTISWTSVAPLIKSISEEEVFVNTTSYAGMIEVAASITDDRDGATAFATLLAVITPQPVQNVGGSMAVTLRRTATAPTTDLALWAVIRKSTESISFNSYNRFMDFALGRMDTPASEVVKELSQKRFLPYNDMDAYRMLKVATEAFLMVNCGVSLSGISFTQDDIDEMFNQMSLDRMIDPAALNILWGRYLQRVNGMEDRTLPYLALIREKFHDPIRFKSSFFAAAASDQIPEECFGLLRNKLSKPCLLELIWSYWHEEGMLVQTMNVLSNRFQNIRNRGAYDPLAMLEIDPLRPLNNLMWGHIQDEQHRLSVVRRAYEYDHHYGLSLYGKAVPPIHGADSRSKFLEAFHNLLHLTSIFFKQDDDTTVIADGFPILNALKEVHFLLTEGAHNQFGDLPSTARQEMLIQQWILARPEFREFLPTRIMVAYPEPWMDRVDAMKKLQGWTDISVREFNSLGTFGEQILLGIRFGAWSVVHDPMQAANWARFWRPEIQGYIHSYRAVTGVDMTADLADTRQASERYLQPSVHLRNRLVAQQRQAR